jgi:outer membrane receptor protein involved in Fe transport
MKPTLCLFLVLLAGAGTLIAGTTGKISGHVADAGSGESLVGANMVLVGAPLGASTGTDGSYVILNIPPGTYDLRVTLVGYGPTLIKGIRIVADQTTTIDAKLEVAAVGLAEVVIQAERPMVQRDATATIAVINSEQIKMMPVKDFVEVLQMQSGVVADGRNLYVRGGRSNEVAYLIDGMYVKDPVLGTSGTRIHNEAISELVFLDGSFNAEYGNALSGVVNIVTKEGGKDFTGLLEGRTSEFGISPFKQYREDRVAALVSGPIAGDNLNFFASGERDARGSWLPFGYDRTLSFIGKLSGTPVPGLKTTLTGRYSANDNRPYDQSWKYIGDQYLKVREKSRQTLLTVTHTVLPNLFYDVRLSYFNQSYYSGIDKDTSQYLSTGSRQYFRTIGLGTEFYSLADPVEVTDNRTETFNVRGDLTWQIGRNNEVRTGFDFKKHNLSYFDVYDPKRVAPYVTDFDKHPVEGAAYIQDKIEMSSLVVSVGLRFDYADQRAPFRSNPLDPASIVPSKAKTQWSPRLGVAHPISDRTALHFSYGHFFQNPDYERLYENSQYDVHVNQPIFGQPDLNAERTTEYEVGITHQFSQTFTASFTAYYKDITGLIGTMYYPPFQDGRYVGYYLYVNEAYANDKGFETRLTMRRSKYVAGSLTYTYSVAKGSASSELENYPSTTQSTLLYPLNQDRTHLLNANVSVMFPESDGPSMFGSYPMENTYWNVIVRVNSGAPYTPSSRRSSFIPINSARMPTTYSIDLEFGKSWKFGQFGFEPFVEILNLTDHKNVLYVWPDTGAPDVTFDTAHSREYLQDPSNYGPPRRIRIGARLTL